MSESERIGGAKAAALAIAGIALLGYGGYGLLQGTGALVWFVPRLKEGGAVVAAIALPWMCGGALLWAAGGQAIRDAVMRRTPTRRGLGTLAFGMVLAGAPGLLWWGWLPFALMGDGRFGFAEAGLLVHFQFGSALLAALCYFAWSRRLPQSTARFGASVGRLVVMVIVCFAAVALWMRESDPDSPVVHNGKNAVEWAKLCHSDEEGIDIEGWMQLDRMGADGIPGWHWLLQYETGAGGRFASVWVSWLGRQKGVVGWYDELFLDDGLAAPALWALQETRPVHPETVVICRQAMQVSLYGLPAREGVRASAAHTLAALGPAARPAFHELLDVVEEAEGAEFRITGERGRSLLESLGEVGLDPNDPRRPETLNRLIALYQRVDPYPLWHAARVVVQLDPQGPDGAAALALLADKATEPQATQPIAAELLEELGPLARPVIGTLTRSLADHLGALHPPFEFREQPADAYNARAVWRAVAAIGTTEELRPLLIAALEHDEPGPRLVASQAMAEGVVNDAAILESLWKLLESDHSGVRSAGAWAIAVQQPVEGPRAVRLVRAVDWFKVRALLPRLSKAQRDRVVGLLGAAIQSDDDEAARVATHHYPEIHERSQELDVEESGAEK